MSRFKISQSELFRFSPLRIVVVVATLAIIALATAWSQEESDHKQRTILLHRAAADDVAPQVANMLREMQADATVSVDRENNALVIRGSESVLRQAGQLVQLLDRTPQRRVDQDDDLDARSQVKAYLVPPEQLVQRVTQLRLRYANNKGVRIVADEGNGKIVVVAPPEIHDEVAGMLARDVARDVAESPIPAREPTFAAVQAPALLQVPLKNITWSEFETYLIEVWGEQLKVTVEQQGRIATIPIPTSRGEPTILQIDRATNIVHVIAPVAAQNAWKQLIAGVDVQVQQQDSTRLVSTQTTDPLRIQSAIKMLQDAARGAANGLSTAAVRFDEQGAGDEVFEVAAQEGGAAAQPDQPPRPPQDNQPNQPGTIQEDLDSGLLGEVQIEFIPEYGVLIIRGKKRDVERVLRLIEKIQEVARVAEPQIVILPLRHVYSGAMADLVIDLYDQTFAPRQGPLSITPLEKPNSLLLIGRREAMQVVEQLVERLDQPELPSTRLKIFRLKHISAVDAETMVNNFFGQQQQQQGGVPGGPAPAAQGTTQGIVPDIPSARIIQNQPTRARVVAEFRTNSLIVQASAGDLDELSYFIKSIDVENPESEHEIHVFHLKHALAGELAPILEAAISGSSVIQQQQGQGQAPGGFQGQPQQQPQQGQQNQGGRQITRPNVRLTIEALDPEHNRIVSSGVLADVTVSADANVNALVVVGPERSMPLIEELVLQLDQPPQAEAQIKVFQIENGDATNLTAMLQELFGLQVTAGTGNLGQTLNQAFGLGPISATGESSLVPLRFAVDVRTNSIIASGSASDLNVVAILLLRLDEGDIETRKIFVYRLKNIYAADVSNSITTFLTNQRTLIQQALLTNQAVSPFEQVEREIIVVPELVSNSLIVSVTPRYYEEIMQVIQDLDFRPPMVMVQVMICEVSLTDNFEFGVELGLQDSLLFDRSVIANNLIIPGFNFNNLPLGNSSSAQSLATRETLAGQSLSTFGLGRTSANLGYGGLVLSAANESVNILIRALQDAGRLQILSRPQVMTLDNQPAFVQVGARISRITGSTITAQGGVTNSTTDVDIGLLLQIQSRINEDGLIVMNIIAEKSELGDAAQGTPVAVDTTGQVINSPPINTTTAQSTISAKSGQTVVFAGLITKNRAVTSRRIPLLSDIPVLGRLFRFDQEADTRTELMIFMTPYIITEDADYEWIKHVESERMSWCLSDILEMHGDVGMSGGNGLWGPPISSTIYPDIDPTGTEAVPTPAPGEMMPLNPGEVPPPNPTPEFYAPPSGPVPQDGSSRRGSIIKSVRTNVDYGPAPARRAPQFPSLVPTVEPSGQSNVEPSALWGQPNNFGEQQQGIEPAMYQDNGYGAFPPP